MKKFEKFFIMTMVAGLVVFSGALCIPIQISNAAIGTSQLENNAVTSPKIKDGEVKTQDIANGAVTKEKLGPGPLFKVVRREVEVGIPANSGGQALATCQPNEVITGGGFFVSAAGMEVTYSGQLENEDGEGRNAWLVQAHTGPTQNGRLQAIATCAVVS